MRCHYEVLQVAREATDEELKKSYRKLALKWHPDKNPDNVDEAKREFILIQQAYELLIDPQERAWYDRHRDSILKGAGSGYKDDSLDIYPYFTPSCYKGYDDNENGFYSIYQEVFNKLAAEESEYLTENESDPPEFGFSKSSYEDVKKFYGYWSSFCTKKSYTWLNTYDISEADNHRILRLMEQENKKVRDRAKKERNDEIRALVAFVRKRDKRVQEYAEYLKQKTIENSKKTEENRRKMIAQHQKNIASYKESEWSKFSNLEKELAEIETSMASEFNDQSDDSEDDDLFCVACNKYFKTEKSFANHEKSKKHKENVIFLKNSMVEEETLVNNDSNSNIGGDDKASNLSDDNSNISIVSDESLEEEELSKKKNTSKSKKNKKKTAKNLPPSDDEETVDLDNIGGSKKQRKKLQREKLLLKKQNNEESNEVVEPVEEEQETVAKSSKKKDKKRKKNDANGLPPDSQKTASVSKLSKAHSVDKNKLANGHDLQTLDPNHECATCGGSFDSKNKLFQHLKSSGHQILLPNKGKNSKTKKKN